MAHVIELGNPLSFSDLSKALEGDSISIQLTLPRRTSIQANRNALVRALHAANNAPPEAIEKHRIYGVNSGFGDNRTGELLSDIARQCELQENLIRSHACGVGEPMPKEIVRLAVLLRANSLAQGYSGVRPEVIDALIALFHADDLPMIPCYGSVGASGDLAPLSHLALSLFEGGPGRERLQYNPRSEGFDCDQTFHLGPKEGLALNNGTTFMLADLILAQRNLSRLCVLNQWAFSIELEALCAVADCLDPGLTSVRPHIGIRAFALGAEAILGSSKRVIRHGTPIHSAVQAVRGLDTVQDDYCIRCTPVALGSALRGSELVENVINDELQSVTDNPVVLTDVVGNARVLSGSHFHGQPLALAADVLKVVVTDLSALCERRLAKLLDKKRNYGLPNHLVGSHDNSGLQSGWMIAQYTAASIVADMKSQCQPQSIDKIPTGNGAEDYVSMGGCACRRARELSETALMVQALELAAAVQAWRLRDAQFARLAHQPAGSTAIAALVRAFESMLKPLGLEFPVIQDRELGTALHGFGVLLKKSNLIVGEFSLDFVNPAKASQ